MAEIRKFDSVVVAETKNMPYEEWLQHRYNGIGGSEISAIAGINKYKSAYRVFIEKRKIVEPQQAGEAAYWGNVLEDVVRKEFAKRINEERAVEGLPPLKIQRRNAILAHPDHNFMRTNLDGMVFGHELGQGIFEAKTASMMLAEDWAGEDIPNQYMLQVQWNMMVTNLNFAYVAVLVGGNDYRQYFIERDQEMIDYLMQIGFNFWHNNVQAGLPPALTGHPDEKDGLRDQYPNSYDHREGEVIHLPNIATKHAISVEAAKEAIKTLIEYKEKNENELKALMGDQEVAWTDKHKISWKTAKNGVKTLRIKLDASEEVTKIRTTFIKNTEKKIKEIDKETAGLEKQVAKARKEIDKTLKAAKKENDKALKDAEKSAKQMQKEAEKAAKELEKETKEVQKVPEYIVLDKSTVIRKYDALDALDELREGVQGMRENGETDLRTVLHYIDNTINGISKGEN